MSEKKMLRCNEVRGNTVPSPQRHWCFTSYKENLEFKNENVRYVIYQQEQCPTSKKLHYQGYIELNKPVRMTAVKKILDDNTAHIEQRKGTREDARNYCMKADTRFKPPIEIGKWIKGSGHRTDLDNFTDGIKNLTPLRSLVHEYPTTYVKYHRGLEKLALFYPVKRQPDIYVEAIIGPSGCGKTRSVIENNPILYNKPSGQWWDGYIDQPVVLIDDLGPNEIQYETLLKWLDRYDILTPVKGGFTKLLCEKIYITSNLEIEDWYPQRSETTALKRRLNKITRYDNSKDEDDHLGL